MLTEIVLQMSFPSPPPPRRRILGFPNRQRDDDDGSRGSSEIKRIVCFDFFLKVVTQPYEAEADNEYVIRGNTAIMKCEVPSFVADFVTVEMWMDTDGNTYYQNSDYGNNTS